MDTVNVQVEFRCSVRCLQGVPNFLRGQFRSALVTSEGGCNTGDHALKCRIWKVFRLTSRMILWRKQQLERRMDLFQKQKWVLVLEQARHSATGFCRKPNPLTPEEELVRRARQAEKFLHQGEVSRARQALCSQARAPGTVATVNELRDPERRPPRLSEAIPADIGLTSSLSWTRRSAQATSAARPEVQQQGWQATPTNVSRCCSTTKMPPP